MKKMKNNKRAFFSQLLIHSHNNLELMELSPKQLEEVAGGSFLGNFYEKWHQLTPKQQAFTVIGALGMLTFFGIAGCHYESISNGISAMGGRVKNAFLGVKTHAWEQQEAGEQGKYYCFTAIGETDVAYLVPKYKGKKEIYKLGGSKGYKVLTPDSLNAQEKADVTSILEKMR